ncbi:cytochrome b [Pseudoalteromonas tunicata]|jgi:cytochrome b561|uniref:Cytochrome b561 family protein n=1 Tax=Pseudoalteromonas tunicata D2 TaxID=87626 RepID=A4C7P8_9GAMM|nr:cytochrome b [Pseudoalteromonas tunicata]ATC95973.1 cytochrome b561 [Pseudoalteromonas tunicata]AXT31509.1 cytochrome b [Pseudoalteromonas tunicata]EAR30002.1 cytochrome b561 family protein [Pseudoalteromonas tunicata D2]MDP4984534.1 cytochrome b [Pseudoalteromonas tunicata]MDP5215346.1 cytochrome b [Pseudoalteromonas tunicata]
MFKNTTTNYGVVAILLHWLMAVAILFLFGLGLYMVELTYYDAWYKGSLDLHKSIGVSLFLLLVIRFAWRLFNPTPAPVDNAPSAKKLNQVAHYMHLLLYVVMLCLMLTGYFISTADGRSIDVFGLFSMPALPISIDQQEDIAGEIHFWLAWSLITFAGVHALAAFKHHFINKDRTLIRMFKVSETSSLGK